MGFVWANPTDRSFGGLCRGQMTEDVLGPVRSVVGRLARRQPGLGVSRGRNGAGEEGEEGRLRR